MWPSYRKIVPKTEVLASYFSLHQDFVHLPSLDASETSIFIIDAFAIVRSTSLLVLQRGFFPFYSVRLIHTASSSRCCGPHGPGSLRANAHTHLRGCFQVLTLVGLEFIALEWMPGTAMLVHCYGLSTPSCP